MEFTFLSDPRFTVRNLSDGIINIPNTYYFFDKIGLFPDKGIRTTYVELDIKDIGDINIIPTGPRGAPPVQGNRDIRRTKVLKTLYMSYADAMMADDIQNLREFARPDSEMFLEDFADKLAEIVQPISWKYRTTHEYMKWGALRGDVYDADGSTVLYNCYDEFDEEQYAFDLKLGTASENGPLNALKEQRRWVDKNRKGEPVTGYLRLCSPELFDAITEHPYYMDIYKEQQIHANHPLFNDLGTTGFRVGNELFIESIGEATYLAEDGSTQINRFIPAGEGLALPLGTTHTFRSYFSPGTMMDNVNTDGLAMYMSTEVMDHNRGVDIFTESAPLFLVQKPRLVHRIYSSNGLAPA